MMDVKCGSCKQSSYVQMYFYNPGIITQDAPICHSQYWEAVVTGKAICPKCGHTIIKEFRKEATKAEIIAIAVGGKSLE